MAGDRVVELVVAPPLTAKIRAGADGPELLVVGSAASLLEGDELGIALVLGEGSRLTVRTVAAQVAHPCPGGGSTTMTVDVTVGEGGRLVWHPEPTIVCAGGRHVAVSSLRLGRGATATWVDELVLGRSGEPVGDVRATTSLSVDLDGWPLLRDGVDVGGPGALGPAVLGADVRYVGAWHELGAFAPGSDVRPAPRYDLAGAGTSWRVVSSDVAAARTALLPPTLVPTA